jgi:dipeptidyl aminopeptidase/acylaminoacyl peptidase
MKRHLTLFAAAAVLSAVAFTYAVVVSRPVAQAGTDLSIDTGRIYFRDADGRVASVSVTDPGGPRTVGTLPCHRFAAAAGAAICLATGGGAALATTDALILDRGLHETRRLQLAGIPSRARVSASGRMLSWTVFVTGDSYNSGGFSTWTGILDTRTGYSIINMENIQLYRDGKRYHAADVNYWGVTFAADDNRFYATVATRGQTYLVEGDYATWEARVLRPNAECPSLSPDGTRLVFKKRVSASAWRLYALDLATLRETPLAETASIDDQVAWLDGETVMYAKGSAVWAVPADGSGRPRMLIADASSPVAVR